MRFLTEMNSFWFCEIQEMKEFKLGFPMWLASIYNSSPLIGTYFLKLNLNSANFYIKKVSV